MNLDILRNESQNLETILLGIGKFAGCVNVFNINTIISYIRNEFSNEIKNAKGIWMELELFPTTTIFSINNIMEFINDDVNSDCETIINIVPNKNLVENTVGCKILFLGLS